MTRRRVATQELRRASLRVAVVHSRHSAVSPAMARSFHELLPLGAVLPIGDRHAEGQCVTQRFHRHANTTDMSCNLMARRCMVPL